MLSKDQFLPGTGDIRSAEPYEQTEAQFHNRDDVYVHGRYEHQSAPRNLDLHPENHQEKHGFHAGTETSAHERLWTHGAPWQGHEARFYHGRVDPMNMQNTPDPGRWETAVSGIRHYDDPGRLEDEGEEWSHRHHNAYYRNDYEDKGSTSVILGTEKHLTPAPADFGMTVQRTSYTPENFQTHRQAVTQALQFGDHVPHHVRAVYEATGGAEGPHAVAHAHFETPTPSRSKFKGWTGGDESLPGLDQTFVRQQQVYGPKPGNKFVPRKHEEPEYDYGGYGSPPGN